MPGQPHDARRRILATFHVPTPLPQPRAEIHGSFEPEARVVAERISFGTQFDMRVPAIVYRPAHAADAPAPAVVVVNGHGGAKPQAVGTRSTPASYTRGRGPWS